MAGMRGVARWSILAIAAVSGVICLWDLAFATGTMQHISRPDPRPLSLYVGPVQTNSFPKAHFGAPRIELSGDEDTLTILISQSINMPSRAFDPARDRLQVHLGGAHLIGIYETRASEGFVENPQVVHLDGSVTRGQINYQIPIGPMDAMDRGPAYNGVVPMPGKAFLPEDRLVPDPTMPDALKDRATIDYTGNTLFFATAKFTVAMPRIDRQGLSTQVARIVWEPSMGQLPPERQQDSLEVGINICPCLEATVIAPESETAGLSEPFVRLMFADGRNVDFTTTMQPLSWVVKAARGIFAVIGIVLVGAFVVSRVPMDQPKKP